MDESLALLSSPPLMQPPLPMHLSWQGVTMRVPAARARTALPCFAAAPSSAPSARTILSSASGALAPGELVAILGASGCGKTTLLSILAGRQRPTAGSVRLCGATGAPAAAGALQFIAQDDLFLPHLTVREHIQFQARLRLPCLPRREAEARGEALLQQLGLASCAGSLIGSAGEAPGALHGRGISGGERKRLSIATALVSSPSLLLADEPTSGLDSANAALVVETLRDLARGGCAIVTSIHGPSSHVFALFDRVILLGEGCTVFSGSAEAAMAHFAKLGAPLPPLTNPADWFIFALSQRAGSDARAQAHNALQRALLAAAASATADAGALGSSSSSSSSSGGSAIALEAPTPPPWLHTFLILFHRNSLSMARDPVLLYTRWLQTIVLSLLAGSVYWRLGSGQKSVMNINGAAFFLLINQGLASIVGVLQTFPVERAVISREHAAGVHSVSAYFLSKSLSALPWELAFPAAFSTVCFFMMQLRPGSTAAWLQLTGVVVLVSQVAVAMGMWVSTVAPTVAVALAIAPVVLLPFILFSGFLLNVRSIAPAFLPLEYTSLFRYGFSASMLILWEGRAVECDQGPLACPFPSGAAVLTYFSLENDSLARDVAALALLALGWRVIALLTLVARTHAAMK
jgi:ABC-type multidrug transport system ATPase subunit/ABC-type multidrug transport system permease subunit